MGCDRATPCRITPIPLEEIPLPKWGGPATGRKAVAYPRTREIWIDPAFWRELRTVEGRAVILFHEIAHLEGARCEPCADRRAGERMKLEGFPTARDAKRAMLGELENRDPRRAAQEVADGFGLDESHGADAPLRKVLHRERADGVHPRLQAFLDEWARSGPFDVLVAVDGGVRWSEALQEQLFSAGRSKARTLGETPHGRGGALDLYPVINGQVRGSTDADAAKPEVIAAFAQLGAFAKAHGLTWGGEFKSITDKPHVELPDWKTLPMPRGLIAAELAGGMAILIALGILVAGVIR